MSNQNQQVTNRWLYAINLGFFAGFFWGLVKIIVFYFGFTQVYPSFLVTSLFKRSFIESWSGHVTGWSCFILFSILSAMLYTVLFQKVKGPWLGLIYGLAWWFVIYVLIGPWLGLMKSVNFLDWNTIITDACIFLLWGLFIGYSVAFEFTDERGQERRFV